MEDLLKHLIDAPIANVLVVAGLFFLAVAVIGNISGKIQPSKSGRIASALLGSVLLVGGVAMHSHKDGDPSRLPDRTPGIHPRAPTKPQTEPHAPTPQGFRVVETLLRADPFDYNGPCPVTIAFSGRISVSGGSGTVAYKFLRSDGASAPVQTLTFDSAGSKDVSTTWRLGGPGLPSFSGWQAIQVFDPQEMRSNEARFSIRCQ